jgi:hypothetical protein
MEIVVSDDVRPTFDWTGGCAMGSIWLYEVDPASPMFQRAVWYDYGSGCKNHVYPPVRPGLALVRGTTYLVVVSKYGSKPDYSCGQPTCCGAYFRLTKRFTFQPSGP